MPVQSPVRRFAVPALVGLFLIVLAGVGIAAFQAEMPGASPFPGGSTPAAEACNPQPCASVQGYDLWISNLSTGSRLVTMTVSFRNASSSTHADPADFELIDSAGRTSQPYYDSGACPHWPRTEFANGATRGPFPICFQPASANPPLKVRWTPDLGIACCETFIRLS
jgi:hypothetical protein